MKPVKKSKVNVKKIHPLGTYQESLFGRHAFLGVSVGSDVSRPECLTAILEWASSRFTRLDILVGDYLHRHNLAEEARSQGSGDEMGESAVRLSGPLRATIRDTLLKYPSESFFMISSADVVKWTHFQSALDRLRKHFQRDSRFRELVLEDVRQYQERRRKRGGIVSQASYDRSAEYILEELAMFSLLNESGATVQLYLGTHLGVLKALSNRCVESPVLGLNDQVCVDLHVSTTN